MNKRSRKRRSEQGSVSIYLILIIVPIFLFVSVLIDFARIMAADRESELAVKAGVRSVMSAFDKDLQSYGLYGQSQDSGHRLKLFQASFAAGLTGTVEGARYLDTKPTPQTPSIVPITSLANPETFRGQVLEEMKIRAPIEFALEITDKFKQNGMTGRFQQGRAFAENAERLEQLLERRERALDDAWDEWKRLYDKANADKVHYESRLKELNGLADQIGLNTVDEIKRSLQQIGEQIRSLQLSLSQIQGQASAALMQQLTILSAKQNELEHLLQLLMQYAALIATTKMEMQAAQSRNSELQAGFGEAMNQAKQANDELRAEWNRLGESAGLQDQFGSVRVMPDEQFTAFQSDAASVTALFGAFAGQVASTADYRDEVYEELSRKNDEYRNRANAVYNSRLAAEEQRKANNDHVAGNKRSQLNVIGDVLDQAKQAIGGCKMETMGDSDRQAYERLEQFEAKYAAGNPASTTAGESLAELNNPRSLGTQAMKLIGFISDAMTAVRDSSYINEFALTKFNYRTYGMELDSGGNPKSASGLSKPEAHALSGQEAEYVTFGFHSCSANAASAYGEMFAIRLAIRTLEQMTEPRNETLQLGSPLLVLLSAVAQGAAQALQDMGKLVKGEEVPLSDKFASALKLSYRDYLRVQMMVHGNSAQKLVRMQSLLELNTGKDLFKVTTKLQAGAGTSVKLWFLPGAVRLLGMAGLTPCETDGGRCTLFHSAEWGY